MLVLLASLIFAASAQAGDKKVEVPAVKIPFVTVGEVKAPYILVGRICQREASFWEELNNGLDSWETCNNLKAGPAQNSSYGFAVKANENGEFEVPAQVITYSHKRLQDHVVCFEISPVAALKDIKLEHPYPEVIATQERLRYCTKTELPKFMSPGLRQTKAVSISEYEKTLSQGVSFTPYSFPQ